MNTPAPKSFRQAVEQLLDVTGAFDPDESNERRFSPDAIKQVALARSAVQAAMLHQKPLIPLVFVIGPTNVGKTTLMDMLSKFPGIGTVEVGKRMRAKYPPSYFKGSAAPAHTETETMAMCTDTIEEHQAAGKKICFIDGQPRSLKQLDFFAALPNPKLFWLQWASEGVRTERALKRDAADEAKLQLSMDRMRGDCVTLFDIVTMLIHRGEQVAVRNTELQSGLESVPYFAAKAIWGEMGVKHPDEDFGFIEKKRAVDQVEAP